MPQAPPRACARCHKPAPKGRACQCRPAFEGSTHPGNTRRWANTRTNQLRAHPICQQPGCRRLATEVDHITPLAEHGARYDSRNLQSLCGIHHTAKTALDAMRGKTRQR